MTHDAFLRLSMFAAFCALGSVHVVCQRASDTRIDTDWQRFAINLMLHARVTGMSTTTTTIAPLPRRIGATGCHMSAEAHQKKCGILAHGISRHIPAACNHQSIVRRATRQTASDHRGEWSDDRTRSGRRSGVNQRFFAFRMITTTCTCTSRTSAN